MKKAKKVFAILTALTLICCVFAGCDSNETPDTTENNGANANAGTEVYKIGIVQLVEHVALDAATEGFNKVLGIMLSNGLVTFAGAFLAIPYRKRQYKAKHMVKSKGGKANA